MRHSPMAEKTRKARKLAMLEFKYIQAVGDAADYEAGREVRVYHSQSTREEIDRRNKFVAERRMLTPCEAWCVAMGYGHNPFLRDKGPTRDVVLIPVDLTDGRRTRARNREQAVSMLKSGVAIRFWDVDGKKYVYASERENV